MIALMIKISTIILMESTVYTFGGDIYLQREGSGIGLRASACLAKVVMASLDSRWARVQSVWGLKVQCYFCYIDDLRIYLWPIKQGWNWTGEGWVFDPDTTGNVDAEARTLDLLCKTLNSSLDFLRFSMESETDFGGWLPTLDVQTRVQESGQISYKFFKKPMSTNLTIQFGSALSSNTIFSTLRQEVTRRMTNTSLDILLEERLNIVEDYISVLVNSGHKYPFIKAVILQGISKYIHMVTRSNLQNTDIKFMPIHRPKEFKRYERILFKYVGKML